MTKLLYIANARIPTPRAYGLTIMKTCEALARAGVTVELITPTRRHKTPGDPFAFYDTEKIFSFVILRVPDFLRLGSIGFFISTVWFAERIRWRASFREADVVCSRDPLLLLQYLLLGKKLLFEPHARPSCISAFVARHVYHVATISEGLKQAYVAAGVPAEKISIAPASVDEHLFDGVPSREEARAKLGISASARIVLYAGHLYPRKGADTLAGAATHVPEATFMFVGGAQEDVAAFKGRWGSSVQIKNIGQVPHEKIPWYLRAADVLVLPNSGKDADSSQFTSPTKLFEYMASGTPIVTSDVPAVREIIDDTMALFVPPDDADALAAGIREAFADPEKAHERALRAQQKVSEYTWARRANDLLSAQ